MKIIYLKPRSSFHNVIDADMLWGILLTALNMIEGKSMSNEIVAACENGEPPFLLSDCFPFIEKESKKKLLFPKVNQKSQANIAGNNEMAYDVVKKYKKVKYLTYEDFQSVINGKKSEFDLLREFSEIKDTDKKEPLDLQTVSNTHTSIDRLTCVTAYDETKKGQLFTTEDTFIANGGLYFLFDGNFSLIESALNYLCHWGIAEDVSSGKGHFEISFEDFSIDLPTNPTHFVSLSGYLPTNEEIDLFDESRTHYELASKTGKLSTNHLFTNQFQKNEVFYMAAGSSFPWLAKKNYGRLREVAKVDEMSIKFNGFAFAIPAILKED